MTELWNLSARELIDHYSRRTLSPVEVTAALLERISSVNPSLTAFVTVTVESALAQARNFPVAA